MLGLLVIAVILHMLFFFTSELGYLAKKNVFIERKH